MASLAVEVASATSLREAELHRMRLAASEFEAEFGTSTHDNNIESSPASREAASGYGAVAEATTRLVQTGPVAARMDLVRVALVSR